MKTIILIQLMSGLILMACSNSPDIIPNDPTAVANAINKGDWRITYYWDSDHEETDHFSDYTFVYEDGGALVATSSNSSHTGTWSSGSDDSQTKLYINFSSPSDFEELSDDWHVLVMTDVKIELEDVSGGNGGTDYLTFEKN